MPNLTAPIERPITNDPVQGGRQFGFLLVDKFSMFSLAAAIDCFRSANRLLGRDFYGWTTISADGDAVRVAAPKNAVAWRPYLSVYGADGATAIVTLGVRDATFAGVYAPDVVALAARLSVIEGQLAAGLPLTTPILPARLVAGLPKPGNRGRKFFALDGRAPNAAGALEAANAGTGVEVTDNGVAWVISGTNQQVQA